MPANRISQILSGKRSVTADTALRLGKWFDTGPKIWLNLQQSYDLDVAKLEIGSDLLMSGPQLFFFGFGEDFESGTVRNIKGCVCDLTVRTYFFKKIGQFFSRPRRSDVTP